MKRELKMKLLNWDEREYKKDESNIHFTPLFTLFLHYFFRTMLLANYKNYTINYVTSSNYLIDYAKSIISYLVEINSIQFKLFSEYIIDYVKRIINYVTNLITKYSNLMPYNHLANGHN